VHILYFVSHDEGDEERFDDIPCTGSAHPVGVTEEDQEGLGGSQDRMDSIELTTIGVDNLLGAAVELALEQGLSISPPVPSAADRWIDSLEEGEEQPVLSAPATSPRSRRPTSTRMKTKTKTSKDPSKRVGEASKCLVPPV
jgi:hypothetical protein